MTADLALLSPDNRDARIMVLCDQAIAQLGEARTIEEVRRVGDMAAAFAAYTRKMKAAVEAQNQCQLVVLLAEARIGAELKQAQKNDALQRRGGDRRSINVRTADIDRPALRDLGIPRQRAAEMRQLAQLGEQHIVEAVREASAAQEPITRAAVLNHRAQGTGENEWYTPAEHIAAARQVMGGIDLDPASSEIANRVVQATRFFSEADDGLSREWHGRVWLNPPYAQPHIANFATKVVAEWQAGRVAQCIALTHNYTDTAWFHTLAEAASRICFTRGRIGFLSPEGKRAAPTQGQAFFYFGAEPARFADVFRSLGLVVARHGV